ATQLELLRSAGAEEAQSIVITCNEPKNTPAIDQIIDINIKCLSSLARSDLTSLT
ncbi:hypothetical protein GR194_26640, partial [Klebsiella pneumoniae]|nr:hypothetical protein [Klebsiella pneumoniae]